jgi:hypothetical protein
MILGFWTVKTQPVSSVPFLGPLSLAFRRLVSRLVSRRVCRRVVHTLVKVLTEIS